MKSMRFKVGVIILRILIIALIVIVIPGYHGLKVHAETVLSWTAAQADGGVTGYSIYMDGTILTTVAGTALSSEITGLAPSTTYSFQIQAGDGDGNWTTDGPEVTVTNPSFRKPRQWWWNSNR